MGIMAIVANAMMVLAYFFNPKLREQRDREKVWFAFDDLEHKLEIALLEKDMYMVDKIRHWLQEYRDKHSFIVKDNR